MRWVFLAGVVYLIYRLHERAVYLSDRPQQISDDTRYRIIRSRGWVDEHLEVVE